MSASRITSASCRHKNASSRSKTGQGPFLEGLTPLSTKPRALTIVELLVVLSVIGLLIALLLPAIQSARETARRTSCASNLRQIGTALNAYHVAHDEFPVGGIEWRPPGGSVERQLAWSAFLLPFIDEVVLAGRLDLRHAYDSAENAGAAATILPVYICPTSPNGMNLVSGRGPCDYGGIFGERITSPNDPPKGIMLYDRAIRSEQVRDGLSQTIIVAEDTLWPDGQWINGRNIFDQAYPVNAAPSFENDIRSLHPGGANVVMADSSVHFLDESMSVFVLAAQCTRDGGELITSHYAQ